MEKVLSYQRELPVKYECDVAVAGGGIAGVCAACAAAKRGASVVLIERFAVAGGNATTGGVASFCGETAGQGELFDEIVRELERFDAIAPYQPCEVRDSRVFDHELLPFILNGMLERYGVHVLYHTRLTDCMTENGRITGCVVCGNSGPEALIAKQYIDCTGEGTLARAAGFTVMKGRAEDGLQLPMSMMFFVRHTGEELCQIPEGTLEPIGTKDDLPMTSIWPNGPAANAIKVKIPCYDSTDTESFSRGEIHARRRILQVMDYFQRVEKRPWRYDHCSPMIGIREGVRIMGDYVLTVEDLRAGRKFSDAVALGRFYLDGHKPDDDKRTYILPKDQLAVPPYHIPLRSLIARDGVNLMMAGRCLSADQLALSSARVMTTCAMMGQAAGVASARSAARGCSVRELDPAELRGELERHGAVL